MVKKQVQPHHKRLTVLTNKFFQISIFFYTHFGRNMCKTLAFLTQYNMRKGYRRY